MYVQRMNPMETRCMYREPLNGPILLGQGSVQRGNPMWTKLELCVLIVLEPTINESELNMHNKGMLRTIACIQQCICLLKSDHITGKKFVFRYWEFHEIPINGNVEHVLSWEFRMGISFHLGFCVGFSGKPELVGPKLQ